MRIFVCVVCRVCVFVTAPWCPRFLLRSFLPSPSALIPDNLLFFFNTDVLEVCRDDELGVEWPSKMLFALLSDINFAYLPSSGKHELAVLLQSFLGTPGVCLHHRCACVREITSTVSERQVEPH